MIAFRNVQRQSLDLGELSQEKTSSVGITCKQCSKINPEGSKLTTVVPNCIKCGTINPVRSAFCGKCHRLYRIIL